MSQAEKMTMYRTLEDKSGVVMQLPTTITEQVYDADSGRTLKQKFEQMAVYASDYTKGDGTNDTIGLQAAIDAAIGKTLIIDKPKVKYVTNRLNIPSNITIVFDTDVLVEAATNFTNFENIFRMDGVDNVNIIGNYATLDVKYQQQSNFSEQRHALTIYGSKNIYVENLNIKNAGGDGIIIGGGLFAPTVTENATVVGCIIDTSQRFGITAVGNVKSVVVDSCIIKNNTTTTASVTGAIDIEPNETDTNRDIVIKNCKFINNSRGVLVFNDSQDIRIENNIFIDSLGVTAQRINATHKHPTVTIVDNNFSLSVKTSAAISVDSVNNVEIRSNKIVNYLIGIYFTDGFSGSVIKPIIRDNKIYDVREGIVIESTTGAVIQRNKIDLVVNEPIKVTGSPDATVVDNDLSDYGAGVTIQTSNDVRFDNNKLRKISKSPVVGLNVSANCARFSASDNDFKLSATNAGYLIDSTTANIGYNIDLDGYKKPFLSDFNPSLTDNLLGQLLLRNQNDRLQLQTVVKRGGELAFARIPTHFIGTAPPTSGNYVVGDFVQNTTPSELGTAGSKYVIQGWSCLATGSPGTWVQCRYLTGN